MKYLKILLLPIISAGLTSIILIIVENWNNLITCTLTSINNINLKEWLIITIVGLISLLIKLAKDRSDELKLIYDFRDRIDKANKTYKWLIDSHLELPSNLGGFLNDKLDTIKTNGRGGLIFLNICADDYLMWLTECISIAKKSFEVILAYPYDPAWFYDTRDMEPEKKINYLNVTSVIKKKKIVKRRIIVNEKEKLRDLFINKMTKENIKDFFVKHRDIELYFLDLKQLDSNIDYIGFKQQIMLAITKDYAMIDKKIVLRKQDSVELAVYIGKNDFLNLFSEENKIFFVKPLIYNKKEIIDEFNLNL